MLNQVVDTEYRTILKTVKAVPTVEEVRELYQKISVVSPFIHPLYKMQVQNATLRILDNIKITFAVLDDTMRKENIQGYVYTGKELTNILNEAVVKSEEVDGYTWQTALTGCAGVRLFLSSYAELLTYLQFDCVRSVKYGYVDGVEQVIGFTVQKSEHYLPVQFTVKWYGVVKSQGMPKDYMHIKKIFRL